MRTRTNGIQLAENGERTVNKQHKGQRIFARLGVISQEGAEAWLRDRQRQIDVKLGQVATRHFCDAAEAYVADCVRRKVKTVDLIGYHLLLLDPYIGSKPLSSVHMGTLESFIDDRTEGGSKPSTINRTLEVVRTVLNKSARVWRDELDNPWLPAPPLIEMLDESGARQPYPISWDEQKRLFAELPAHLYEMALYAVNTGCRDENVVGLRWSWERRIPELGRSVFVVPASEFKGDRPHVVILNDVAWSVVEARRGRHEEYVFTYCNEKKRLPPNRIDTINNTGWQKARGRAKLAHVRVHDLRHTYGQRLRDAGVSKEDRDVLMGHKSESMGEHYATPTIAKLIEMANMVSMTRDTPTLLRVVNG